MQVLANRLKELREESGLSQKQAAQALFISNTSLSNYELNVSTPSPETLVEICKFYNVSMDYLFGITDVKQKSDDLPSDEAKLLNNYSKLSEQNKSLLLDLLKAIENKADIQ